MSGSAGGAGGGGVTNAGCDEPEADVKAAYLSGERRAMCERAALNKGREGSLSINRSRGRRVVVVRR